ncbi:PHD finger domain protein, putative [Talaromyces stipitatus ATCC 10500]|uniref:PHD finger domain protein, putative n=1 Tax=Talaromyces stipitatus (strain ATCC 10500 / CBS 375.48 / QM 6759 / NRRL 1006) TaxID=441959 RepID=B8MPW9_TALSN|nr:PHD finger domain protein, putative [Talaromyces stipitatus ATCC 10500]EED12859.1 PHD finger domain protein, putative [Talaromyces stipitatus ATCC 10500]
MAPHLRSSSRATSNNSRPSTPTATLPPADYIYGDSNRPRKQRRTGRNSRVGVESMDDSREATTEPQDASTTNCSHPLAENGDQPNRQPHVVGADGKITIDQLVHESKWDEPPVRDPQPSYKDYTWSGAWYGTNPALSTMRPLGQLPNASDKRKAGLKPPKPPAKETKANNKNKAAKKTASQQNSTPVNEVVTNKSDSEPLPLFTSSEFDVEKLRTPVQAALSVAEEKGDLAVSQGLRQMWKQGTTDPFMLSVLNSVMRKTPDAEQKAVFKAIMRAAYKQTRPTLPLPEATEAEPISRSLSTNSITSVSSAKSADASAAKPITTTTMTENGTGAVTRGRKRARDSEIAPSSTSNLVDASGQKRSIEEVYDGEEKEDAASVAKRTRRDNFSIMVKPSQIRSSLSRESPMSASGPRTRNKAAKSNGLVSNQHAADEGPDNNDFCRQCQRSGSLLCCDGCVNSYHFSCLEPPLDPAHPPEGEWFCPSCQMRNSFGSLVNNIKDSEQDFQLPLDIREYYQGVQTGKGGVYQQVAANLRPGTHGRGKKEGSKSDQEFLTRQFDAKGKLIVCIACGLSSNGTRPIIQCDYCPCYWHMDCTDPPMPIPPKQQNASEKTYHNWMCPNHIDHELAIVHDENGGNAAKARIRRPRNPRVIDVDVLPDDSEVEELQETETQGIVYRVSENGLKLNFLERVKRENFEAEVRASAAAQYRDYACRKLDQLVERATAFYEKAFAPEPSTVVDDARAAILNSRSDADREAVANLVAFATENRDAQLVQSEKIGYLVDVLLASSPDGAPKALNELDSLQALKDLIDRRIGVLQSPD